MSTIITIDPDGTIEIEQGEVPMQPQNGLEGHTEGSTSVLEACPIETSDVAANLAARDNAIAVANYGPLDRVVYYVQHILFHKLCGIVYRLPAALCHHRSL